MASTPYSWRVGGADLGKYAWNISSRTGMMTPPPVRGSSRQIPFKSGTRRAPRMPDERLLELSMWVLGADPETGDVPEAPGPLAQFEENLDFLQRLFYRPDEYLPIVRRRARAAGTETTTGTCQYVGGLDPEMTGNTRAVFAVDLLMSDPWFYGPDVAVNVAAGASAALENPGSVKTHKIGIVLNGPLTNPVVRNTTAGVRFTYGSSLTTGQTATIDVWEWDAERENGSKVWGLISHAGSRHWMVAGPGTNTFRLTADAGTGSMDVTVTPAHL